MVIETAIKASESMSVLDKFHLTSMLGGAGGAIHFLWGMLFTSIFLVATSVTIYKYKKASHDMDKSNAQDLLRVFVPLLVLGVILSVSALNSAKLTVPIQEGYYALLSERLSSQEPIQLGDTLLDSIPHNRIIHKDIVLSGDIKRNQVILVLEDHDNQWGATGFYPIHDQSFSEREQEFLNTAFKVTEVNITSSMNMGIFDIDYICVVKPSKNKV